MNKILTLFVSILFSLSLIGIAAAKGGPSVDIKGDGVAQNYNSGAGQLLSHGKISAKMKSGKVKGKIKAETILANAPNTNMASIEGEVVCIEETAFESGVWEVRFMVTAASGLASGLESSYGSMFVADGGDPGAGNDMIDESFANSGDPNCGTFTEGVDFGLEEVVAGNFEVKIK